MVPHLRFFLLMQQVLIAYQCYIPMPSEVHERADAKKCLGSLIVTLIVIPRFVVKVLEAELAK